MFEPQRLRRQRAAAVHRRRQRRRLDEDHDGYTNADEIDNGTDPCSAADVPHDWNRNFVSDLNDPDDDSDGLPDTSDPFADRPGERPRPRRSRSRYSWENGAPSTRVRRRRSRAAARVASSGSASPAS